MVSALGSAIRFARKKHKNQKYGKLPYIEHSIGVLDIVSNATEDEDILCAAVLHDVVEDCNVSLDDIEKRFGPDVSLMVKELSKKFTKPKDITNEGAFLIKMADCLYNLLNSDSKQAMKTIKKHRKTFLDKGKKKVK
jgi:(p)ppGpp synthase/HD superfamily hydrolase